MLVQTSSLSDPFAKSSGQQQTQFSSSGAQGKSKIGGGATSYVTETYETYEEVQGGKLIL